MPLLLPWHGAAVSVESDIVFCTVTLGPIQACRTRSDYCSELGLNRLVTLSDISWPRGDP
jgi:hypothetical protein